METKISIRKRMLQLRGEMTDADCVEKSRSILQNLLTIQSVQKAGYILCYADHAGEVCTGELIEKMLFTGKKVYVPKVCGEDMDFYRIDSLDDLCAGYKGILEPEGEPEKRFTEEMLKTHEADTVMLLPGVAFDKKGGRIGYGKGYYDRYLLRIPCKERIALSYQIQIIEDAKSSETDIPLTGIVTENEILQIQDIRNEEFYEI